MGVLPDRLPGYVHLDSAANREAFDKLWGSVISSKPGLTSPQIVEAAQSGKLKALHVMGANPFAHFGTLGYGRGKLEFLVVQEMFLTDTAKVADVVFPAASAYEKDGTVTNTSGEIQLLRKGAEVMGTRTDFDLLRILSHQTRARRPRQSLSLQNPRRRLRGNSQSRSRLQRGHHSPAHRQRRAHACASRQKWPRAV